MKRLSVLSLLLVLLLTACQVQPSPVAVTAPPKLLDPALGQKLQAALEAAVASPDTRWPGAILYVRAPGLGEWSGAAGLGAVETKSPMRPHDRFRAGSLTKPFIAAVVLQLVEEGRFTLDDPITKLLPDQVTGKFANSDRITVRMLLNHTSGLADFMQTAGPALIAQPDKVWKVEEFLDFAAAQKPMFAPGEAQYYSNTNYALLGMIIEKVTGRTWREELRQRIFEPLNLKDTLLPAPEEMALPGDHAHGYADFGNGMFDATDLVTASVVGAAGGQSLITNAPDLTRFMDALLAGRLFKKAGTLDQMLDLGQVRAEPPDERGPDRLRTRPAEDLFGPDLTAIGHSGDTEGGYSSFVFHFPKQQITIAGAVNMNDPAAGFGQLMPRVLEVLVPGYTMPQPVTSEQAEAGAALQGLLDDQVQKQGILGMAMAVRMADGTVVSRGFRLYRSRRRKTPGPWTQFPIWPVSPRRLQPWSSCNWFRRASSPWTTRSTSGSRTSPMATRSPYACCFPTPVGWPTSSRPRTRGIPNGLVNGRRCDLVAEANRLGPVDEPGRASPTMQTPITSVGIDHRSDHRKQLGAGGSVTHHRTPPS